MGLLDKKTDVEENEEKVDEAKSVEAKSQELDKVESLRTKPKPVDLSKIVVDTERVEFTESVNFTWAGVLNKKKVGDIMKVSKDLRDVLLTRGCVRIKPN